MAKNDDFRLDPPLPVNHQKTPSHKPNPFESAACPSCGTALIAVHRDRLLAAVPETSGWTRDRAHGHDYWANFTLKMFIRPGEWIEIICHVQGRDRYNPEPPAGTLTVTCRHVYPPGHVRRFRPATQWPFLQSESEEAIAKVQQLVENWAAI